MRYRHVAMALCFAAVMAFSLAACHDAREAQNALAREGEPAAESSQDDAAVEAEQAAAEAAEAEAAAAEQASDPVPYPGIEPRAYPDDLIVMMEDAIGWATGEQERANEINARDESERPNAEDIAARFADANAAYRSGDYEAAVSGYESVLMDDPLHFGANVNLALAQLQNERNTEGLMQALKCVYLFPDDPGCLLNAQVAGTACGFKAEDITNTLADLIYVANGNDMYAMLSGEIDDDFKSSFEYNNIWNRVETELYGMDASSEGAKEAYDDIDASAFYLVEDFPDKSDCKTLLSYVTAVGDMTGLSSGSADSSGSGDEGGDASDDAEGGDASDDAPDSAGE